MKPLEVLGVLGVSEVVSDDGARLSVSSNGNNSVRITGEGTIVLDVDDPSSPASVKNRVDNMTHVEYTVVHSGPCRFSEYSTETTGNAVAYYVDNYDGKYDVLDELLSKLPSDTEVCVENIDPEELWARGTRLPNRHLCGVSVWIV